MKKAMLAGLLLLFLTGCGRDASDLTVVTGIGVDGLAGEYRIGAEVIKLTGGQDQSQSLLLSAGGQTVTDGIDGLAAMTGRSLYCNHAQILIVGRDTAEKDILPLLEELLRGNQYPISLRIAVAKGTAAQVLKTKPTISDLHSVELEDMIRQGSAQSLTADMNICRLYQDITAPGIEGVLPFVDIREDQGQQVCTLAGTALFRGEALTAVLNEQDSRTLMWMRGQSGGTLSTDQGLLEIIGIDRRLHCGSDGARLTLKIRLRVTGSETKKVALSALAEQTLQRRCESLLARLQTLECDAVGFGQRLYQEHPGQWDRLTMPWPEYFAQYPIAVKVQVADVVWGRMWAEQEADDGA